MGREWKMYQRSVSGPGIFWEVTDKCKIWINSYLTCTFICRRQSTTYCKPWRFTTAAQTVEQFKSRNVCSCFSLSAKSFDTQGKWGKKHLNSISASNYQCNKYIRFRVVYMRVVTVLYFESIKNKRFYIFPHRPVLFLKHSWVNWRER